MTSNAAKRALAHWHQSEWWSWVYSVEYHQCRNRDSAYKLETKLQRAAKPLFLWTGGYAKDIAELDAEFGNPVLGLPHSDVALAA